MRLSKFLFPFLFTRNWHTGEYELSEERAALFGGMLFLILLGVLIVAFLQAPVEYAQ